MLLRHPGVAFLKVAISHSWISAVSVEALTKSSTQVRKASILSKGAEILAPLDGVVAHESSTGCFANTQVVEGARIVFLNNVASTHYPNTRRL